MTAVPSIDEAAGFRRLLDSLDPSAPPEVRVACGASLAHAKRLVVLPASFNPPHVAHLALLEAGVGAARADAAAFLLSVRTVDKERPTGMLLEDRLWLMCRLLSSEGGSGASLLATGYSLLVCNRGLYVDMAAALGAAAPGLEDLAFVVGYDKVVQIFDPRYYEDREVALQALVARARLLVAPRDDYTARDITTLLAQPENTRYASGVETLELDPRLALVSSTAARERAAAGGDDDPTLPEAVRRFIVATGCYRDEPRYAARAEAISAAARAPGGPAPPP